MIKLSDISTKPPSGLSKKDLKKDLKEMSEEIGDLLLTMYAESKHNLLIVFQGMDSSGKDGVTKNVFKDSSPVNIGTHSFKKPSKEEFAHDFLWRCHKLAPRKGHVQVFIRSHYEDILIQRVHNWITPERVAVRMKAINAFEELLRDDNNTTILKFYLHLSEEHQLEKLQERIDDPEKHWKHKDGDWEERKHWSAYKEAYEYAINESTIPWIIAPADSRSYRNYFVAKKVLKTLRSLDMSLPPLDSEMFGTKL